MSAAVAGVAVVSRLPGLIPSGCSRVTDGESVPQNQRCLPVFSRFYVKSTLFAHLPGKPQCERDVYALFHGSFLRLFMGLSLCIAGGMPRACEHSTASKEQPTFNGPQMGAEWPPFRPRKRKHFAPSHFA
jgi:hypothetical protein